MEAPAQEHDGIPGESLAVGPRAELGGGRCVSP